MDYLSSSDFQGIMVSKRANIYYLEKCRVMQKDGKLVYLRKRKNVEEYYNIPVANTIVLILGTGTSITQAAARELASAGVIWGFCGDNGSPLLCGEDIYWQLPTLEYRETKYFQGWLSWWYDDKKRFEVAKSFQSERCNYVENIWARDKDCKIYCLDVGDDDFIDNISKFRRNIERAKSITELLGYEGDFTKGLYKYVAQRLDLDFARKHKGQDICNRFLDHGNYLAYGIAAEVLWVLGISYSFPVMHGKTRRGALVFDVADLIKDAIILPNAFVQGENGCTDQEFRDICTEKFIKYKSLDFMFEIVEKYALKTSF